MAQIKVQITFSTKLLVDIIIFQVLKHMLHVNKFALTENMKFVTIAGLMPSVVSV